MIAALRNVCARLHRSQEGFTIIEALVAIVVLTIALGGMLTVFDSSRNLTSVGYGEQAATQVAQRELESIASLGYSNIGLSTAPTHSTDSSNPDYYVTSAGQFSYDWTNTSVSEPFCVATATGSQYCAGNVATGPTAWTSQDVSGNIYRFITWAGDTCGNCNGTYDYKRITVVVTVTPPSTGTAQTRTPTNPVLVSTIVTNPSAGPGATG